MMGRLPSASRGDPACWVIPTACVSSFVQRFPGEDLAWCYLGTDPFQRREAAGFLSPARNLSIREELTRVALEIKQPFLDWIGEIGLKQKDKPGWWSSRLASSSPLQTDFFLLVCYFEWARAWLSQGPSPSGRIFVVEDPWLFWMLKRRFASDRRVRFPFGGWAGITKDLIFRWVKIPWSMGIAFSWALWSWGFSRWLFPRERTGSRGSESETVLLYTWIEPRCFSIKGQFQDWYTGRLEEILRRQGKPVRRLTPLQVPGRCLIKLKEFRSRFIVTARAICLGDILKGMGSWFIIRDLPRSAQFRGCDIRPLVYRELLREWSDPEFSFYQLWYRVSCRLAKSLGCSVQRIIYPFENQPWEKLLCLAWREYAPHIQLIGYQHTWVPPLLLPYSLGEKNQGSHPLPDRIVANGEFNLERLREGGYPVELLVNAGALRHEYLTSDSNGASPGRAGVRTEPNGKERSVLVTFPLSKSYSRCLFMDLLEEFQEPLRHGGGGDPVRFILKCHPQLPVRLFYGRPFKLPPWIRFSREPMSGILSCADLLLFLYVGETSSWLEAAFSGVPVLKYEVDLLDIDIGHEMEGISVQVCSRQTLRSSIESILGGDAVRKRPHPAVIKKMFGPVDEKVWSELVGSGRGMPG